MPRDTLWKKDEVVRRILLPTVTRPGREIDINGHEPGLRPWVFFKKNFDFTGGVFTEINGLFSNFFFFFFLNAVLQT